MQGAQGMKIPGKVLSPITRTNQRQVGSAIRLRSHAKVSFLKTHRPKARRTAATTRS